MAKKESLTEKKVDELKEMLVKSREEMKDLRFAAAGARTAEGSSYKNTRKQVARILTELGNRKRA